MQHYGKLAAGGASVVYCDDFAELYDHFLRYLPDVGKFTDWAGRGLSRPSPTTSRKTARRQATS